MDMRAAVGRLPPASPLSVLDHLELRNQWALAEPTLQETRRAFRSGENDGLV
jgi:hypothetical protein